jgi:muconolactone delta-isomerase
MVFSDQFIPPTLERCKKLEAENKIVAGGSLSGATARSLIVSAESAEELHALITSLPVWPLLETTVTPLTSFDGRRQKVRALLGQIKAQGGVR